MRFGHLFLLLMIPCFLLAQNWDPINSGYIYNFQEDTTDLISQSVWTDSVTTVQGDSVLFLNRIARVSDYIMALNLPHFLGKYVHKTEEKSTFFLASDTAFVIFPQTPVNGSWLADSLNSLHCEVVHVAQQQLFGTPDSIKVLVIPETQDTLILSRSFGWVEFQHPYNDRSFELKGIDNLKLGETVLSYKEIFEMNPGDVFFYSRYYSAGYAPTYRLWKRTILESTWNGDTLETESNYRVRDLVFDYFNNKYDTLYTESSGTSSAFYQWPYMGGAYPNQLASPNAWQEEFDFEAQVCQYFRDENGVPTKGIMEGDYDDGLLFYTSTGVDTLEPPFCHVVTQMQAGLGVTTYIRSCSLRNEEIRLIGYIKDGVAHGITYEDWMFTDTRRVPATDKALAKVFPNPVSPNTPLHLQALRSDVIRYELRSPLGGLLRRGAWSGSTDLELDEFPSGWYILNLEQDGIRQTERIFVNHP